MPNTARTLGGKDTFTFTFARHGVFVENILSVITDTQGVRAVDPPVIKNEQPHPGALLSLEGDSKHTVAHGCSFLFQPVQFDLAEIGREEPQEAYIGFGGPRNGALLGHPKRYCPGSDANQARKIGLDNSELRQSTTCS